MHRNLNCTLLLVTLALTALPSAANAVPLYSVSETGYVYFGDANSNILPNGTVCSPYSAVVGGTAGCLGTATAPVSGTTLNYDTSASANLGVLHAYASSSITGAPGTVTATSDSSSSVAQASFTDTWTITGGTGTATLGLQFALDGTYSNGCASYAGYQGGISLTELSPPYPGSLYDVGYQAITGGCSGTLSDTALLTIPFTYGVPVNFEVTLTMGSILSDLLNNIGSTMDFLNTATMNMITVTDSNGNPLSFYLTTASGTPLFNTLAPSPPTNSVPEPESLMMFGIGLLGLLAVFRKGVGELR